MADEACSGGEAVAQEQQLDGVLIFTKELANKDNSGDHPGPGSSERAS